MNPKHKSHRNSVFGYVIAAATTHDEDKRLGHVAFKDQAVVVVVMSSFAPFSITLLA